MLHKLSLLSRSSEFRVSAHYFVDPRSILKSKKRLNLVDTMVPYDEIKDLCHMSEDIMKTFMEQAQNSKNPNPQNPLIDMKSLSSRVGHDHG